MTAAWEFLACGALIVWWACITLTVGLELIGVGGKRGLEEEED